MTVVMAIGIPGAGTAMAQTSSTASSPTATRHGGTATTTPTAPAVPAQMISPGHLAALVSAGLPQATASFFFDQPGAMFNLGANGATVSSVNVARVHTQYPKAQIGWLFNSFATNTLTGNPGLQAVLSKGAVPTGITYIQYDPEGPGNGTPATETKALEAGNTTYIAQAAALAHAHGLRFYLTPSIDAGMKSGERSYPTKYTTWLTQGRGAWAAIRGVDMYSIQSQQAEATSVWGTFVPAAVAQAHHAAAGVPIDIGIGINPANPATAIKATDLEQAYVSGAKAGAAGYWNNVEIGVGAKVPASVYVTFFNWLYKQIHG